MTMHMREPVKFDATEIDLNKTWTTHVHSRGDHMTTISHPRSLDRIKLGILRKHEKTFQPNEYWSIEIYPRKKFQNEKAHVHLMKAKYLNSKLIVRAHEHIDFQKEVQSFYAWGTLSSIIFILGTSYLTWKKVIPIEIGGPISLAFALFSISFITECWRK